MKKIRALVLDRALPSRLLFVTVWLSLFAYAGRPLLVAAHAEGVAPAVAWLALLGCSFLPMLPILARRTGGLIKRALLHWTGYVVLGLFSLLLVLVALSDLVRLLFAISVQTMSFSVLAAAAGLSLVGLFQARFPRVKRVSIAIDHLPDDLTGYRIVQWSDVHVGPTIQRRFVQALVKRTNAIGADAIAITGDLIDGYVDDLRDQVQPLADLRARDGVFYVTGNHEYYWRAGEWVNEIERLGLTFLKNRHRVIERGSAKLLMAGVTDPAGRDAHKPDVAAALEGAPAGAVKVLLSHRPQTARTADRFGVDIQLSGHTHGGQFFPFNILIRLFQPIVAGLHRVGRTWLYVSRGTGYWGPPSRLGVHGEITVITLNRSI
ncbi:MAG TPA: metallophosphoesterase [Thermoanaerobaculia bacterium]|nr:metallophosphoesterase [Thermoanaerobaculia bacterium]